jgi:ribosomal protein S18 acetylase RimI-like enzyme
MSGDAIEFREKTARLQDVQAHLEECDANFSAPLRHRIDIADYAGKICANAVTFEAWSGRTLVGLVAAYLNDRASRIGYITNVSVVREFMGHGIATALLGRCLGRARQEGMIAVRLEVRADSHDAIRAYLKSGFAEQGRKGDTVLMEVAFEERHQS